MEKQGLQIAENYTVWQKFCRNKLALAGLIFIGIVTVFAILGYVVCPDNSTYSNRQCIEIAAKKPGFSATFLKIPLNKEKNHSSFLSILLYGKPQQFEYIPINNYHKSGNYIVFTKFSEEKGIGFSDSILLSKLQMRLSNSIKNEEVEKNNIEKVSYLLGTDRFGRDMLSRLIIGSRISLSVGFIAVLLSLVIGLVLGAIAGFFRGWVDSAIMWVVNVTWSVPTLLMVISITMVLGKGFWQVFIAVGLTMWVEVARIVRGQVMSIREKDYIEACRAMGFSNFRIISKHIIPNTLGPVIIISAANFASAILIEAGLSFLGVGVQPPVPSWGNMIKDHYGYIILDKAYLAILPGLAIMLLVLAFTFVGNGLRDAFDSKSVPIQ